MGAEETERVEDDSVLVDTLPVARWTQGPAVTRDAPAQRAMILSDTILATVLG